LTLSLPYEFIAEPGRLVRTVQELRGSPAIAVDTEANSRNRYPEQLCLIQIATRTQVYILDTITLPEIAPLGPTLSDASIVKVVHGADYDIRSLDRHAGLHMRGLFDTSIAARFAGITEFGLASLLRDVLKVSIAKQERLQMADWGRRPLSVEALDYAASDVRHLLPLREALQERLRKLGRTEWVAEECSRLEQVRYAPPDIETAFLSLKGTRELDGHGLAVLRSLFNFRDREARRQHKPPYYVLPEEVMVFLAGNPRASFSRVPGASEASLRRLGTGLEQALREGENAPPVQRPSYVVERPGEQEIGRLNRLKIWRKSLGSELSLDPALLWPMASLERLAKNPGTLESEIQSELVRKWQRDAFHESLRRQVQSLS
jgi:ribonuclease D